MGIKMSPNTFPSGMCYCDGYVKYEQSKVDRIVAIFKTNNCGGGGGGGGGGACGIQ